MIGASSCCCCCAHVVKSPALTICALLSDIEPCHIPHSSEHSIRYVPIFRGCMSTLLSCTGTASALTPAAKNQNEWVTSSDVTWNSISRSAGMTRCALSKPPKLGYRYVKYHC